MTYGVKYKIVFKNRQEEIVTVNILEKDYTNPAVTELEATGDPFILDYQMDEEDIFQPIRSSKAKIQYWNNNGYPVTLFAADDEDKYKVEVYVNSNFGNYLYWTGFIVQDDCREDFMPTPNVVTLNATDNIGLLKNISADKGLASKTISIYSATLSLTVGDSFPLHNLIGFNAAGVPQINGGETIEITGTSFDGTYTVAGAVQVGTANVIRVNEALPTATETGTIVIKRGISVYDKSRINEIFDACLRQTGLQLPLNTYCNVFENGIDDRTKDPINDPLNAIRISNKSWIKGKAEYNSCYEVLERILKAWKCTLFQSKGEWFIVRWLELKQFNNAIPGTRYEFGLLNPTSVTFDAIRIFAKDYSIYPINANHIKSIVRSNKYTKLSYDYEQPFKLILNDDLLTLGAFISTTTIGDYKYDRYELVDVEKINNQTAYIEVVTYLVTGDETQRYIVMEKNASTSAAIKFSDIEVNAGDKFNFNFSWKTTADLPSMGDIVFVSFRLYINSTDYYALKWHLGSSYQQNYFYWDGPYNTVTDFANEPSIGRIAEDDLTQWSSYSFGYHAPTALSARMPADGLLKIYIYGYNLNYAGATYTTDLHLKDFKIDLRAFINDSTQIIGQVHKAEQTGVKKQNYEEQIYIDDAPRNSIKGAMFIDDGTTKTLFWHRGATNESVRFGHIQKTDLLFVTDAYRTRIEGDFKGLKDNSSYVNTLFNVFTNDVESDKYFIMGNCSFNLHTCQFNAVMEEIWRTGETYDETVYNNTFKYVYNK